MGDVAIIYRKDSQPLVVVTKISGTQFSYESSTQIEKHLALALNCDKPSIQNELKGLFKENQEGTNRLHESNGIAIFLLDHENTRVPFGNLKSQNDLSTCDAVLVKNNNFYLMKKVIDGNDGSPDGRYSLVGATYFTSFYDDKRRGLAALRILMASAIRQLLDPSLFLEYTPVLDRENQSVGVVSKCVAIANKTFEEIGQKPAPREGSVSGFNPCSDENLSKTLNRFVVMEVIAALLTNDPDRRDHAFFYRFDKKQGYLPQGFDYDAAGSPVLIAEGDKFRNPYFRDRFPITLEHHLSQLLCPFVLHGEQEELTSFIRQLHISQQRIALNSRSEKDLEEFIRLLIMHIQSDGNNIRSHVREEAARIIEALYPEEVSQKDQILALLEIKYNIKILRNKIDRIKSSKLHPKQIQLQLEPIRRKLLILQHKKKRILQLKKNMLNDVKRCYPEIYQICVMATYAMTSAKRMIDLLEYDNLIKALDWTSKVMSPEDLAQARKIKAAVTKVVAEVKSSRNEKRCPRNSVPSPSTVLSFLSFQDNGGSPDDLPNQMRCFSK